MSTYLRFRRRLPLLGGLVHLNVNKRSASVSVGAPGAHLTFGPHGRRASLGIPGSGLSVINYARYPHHTTSPHPLRVLLIVLALTIALTIALGIALAASGPPDHQDLGQSHQSWP